MIYFSLIFCISVFITCDAYKEEKIEAALEKATTKCTGNVFANCTINVIKYNRTSPYYLNGFAEVVQPVFDNVTFQFKSYEWKNNQFKESFIYFEDTICNIMSHEKWILPLVRKYSNLPSKCPLKVGYVIINNLSADLSFFPKKFPLSRWLFRVILKLTESKQFLAEIKVELNIRESRSNSRSKKM